MNSPRVGAIRPKSSLTRRKKFLFSLLTCLFLFAVVEIALRLSIGWGRDWRPSHCWHPTLGWRLRPNWVGKEGWMGGRSRINPQGLREDTPAGPKPAGEKRLLVLGDSVVFGACVRTDQTYTSQLNNKLTAAGLHWRALNGGVIGYDSAQEADWLELYGLALEPDALAIGFCRNDLQPSRRNQFGSIHGADGLGRWLTDHCLLAHYVQRWLWSLEARLGWATATETTADEVSKDPRPGLLYVESAYRRIARVARERHLPVTLLLFPTIDMFPPHGPDALTAWLTELAHELGWTVIDLAPAFGEDSASLFVRNDPVHPNAAGFIKAVNYSASAIRNALPH
jgi:lysophospholipase L1-like esterase